MEKINLAKRITISVGIALMVASGVFFYLLIKVSSVEVVKDCKVLETYEKVTGKYNHREFIIIVNVLEYNKITDLTVSPSVFYRASEYMKTNRTARYEFSLRQISELNGKQYIGRVYFSLSFAFFIIALITFSVIVFLED